MPRMFVASQADLRALLKTFATGETAFDANAMAKVWVDGVESLAFLLSKENRDLLQLLQLGPPESIADLVHSAQIEPFDLTRQLQLLANYHLLRFEGKDNAIIPVAEPGRIEVTIL